MKSIDHTEIRGFAMTCGIILLLHVCCVSCIKEDPSKCDPTTLLYIVVEVVDGEIPALEGATLFLFNSDRTYRTSISVSAEDIAGNVPISIPDDKRNLPWAVVWGNLDDREQVSVPVQESTIESMFVSMKKDADGYAIPSSDLFFGIKQLSGTDVEYIISSPKPGRIFITVKGLTEIQDAEQYYFTVESPYGGYDFAGLPISSGKTEWKLLGIFEGNDLVTSEAHNMVHFPSATESVATVNLYKNAITTSDQLLASIDKDINGKPIVLPSGLTTNVLIDFAGNGELKVSVVITDWGEIHQWSEW